MSLRINCRKTAAGSQDIGQKRQKPKFCDSGYRGRQAERQFMLRLSCQSYIIPLTPLLSQSPLWRTPTRTLMSLRMPRIVLASRSPRRRQLLEEAGYEFVVCRPCESAEDGTDGRETPAEMVAHLARRKAKDVATRCSEGLVIGCDTVVECGGQILGKPDDIQHARHMLQSLRGNQHHVYSGLCLWAEPSGRHTVKVAMTRLVMCAISDDQLEDYLQGGDWEGKAGAFGYQDGHDWLRILEGSESNVVGLPLELLAEMIQEFQTG